MAALTPEVFEGAPVRDALALEASEADLVRDLLVPEASEAAPARGVLTIGNSEADLVRDLLAS